MRSRTRMRAAGLQWPARAAFAHRNDLCFPVLGRLVEGQQELISFPPFVIALGRNLAARLHDAEQLTGGGADRTDTLRLGRIHETLPELLQFVHDVVAFFLVILRAGGAKRES